MNLYSIAVVAVAAATAAVAVVAAIPKQIKVSICSFVFSVMASVASSVVVASDACGICVLRVFFLNFLFRCSIAASIVFAWF